MKNNNEQILFKALEKKNDSMTEEELVNVSKIRLSTVRATLGKMVKDRKIRRAGGGKFCLVSKAFRR